MANVIATLLDSPATINTDEGGMKGPQRHVYEELTYLQTDPGDPALASPYLKAAHVTTVPAHTDTITSGNFTITMNFPNYGVAKTTANIAFDDEQAAIQTAVDNALDGETIVGSYTAGDVDVALTGNLTANAATLTANGDGVNGAYMVVTTSNVDLDADKLGTPVVATAGTMNRPAEATLALFDVVKPSDSTPYQGQTVTASDFEVGDNPFSLSPGTVKALVKEAVVNEDDPDIGLAMQAALEAIEL
jgi:hypothetical protein